MTVLSQLYKTDPVFSQIYKTRPQFKTVIAVYKTGSHGKAILHVFIKRCSHFGTTFYFFIKLDPFIDVE